MGPSTPLPIPWPMLQEYADRLGLGPDDRVLLERVLTRLDLRHIELETESILASIKR